MCLINRKIHWRSVILMHTKLLNFWKLEIGERVIINQHCLLDCRKYKIVIENDTDIGTYTKIWTLGHDPDSDTHDVRGGDVLISHHVWIASNATILPGVVIGAGAVVAASSLVHKSIHSLEVVGGNPAKFIKSRHNSLTYRLGYTPFFE